MIQHDRGRYSGIFKACIGWKNIRFEELPCKDQELSFEILHRKLKETVRIENFDKDTLKTLNLYDDVNGFNNAAGLLADKNHFSGNRYCQIWRKYQHHSKEIDFWNISVLEVYEKAIDVFRDYYQYEVIQGADRKKMEKYRKLLSGKQSPMLWFIECGTWIRKSEFRCLMIELK